jgi:hypothetical protein
VDFDRFLRPEKKSEQHNRTIFLFDPQQQQQKREGTARERETLEASEIIV